MSEKTGLLRWLTDHEIDDFNRDNVQVYVMDKPDPEEGGACHEYELRIHDKPIGTIKFQHGPAKDGANGVSEAALLAIILDRYRTFQDRWKGRGAAVAITRIEEALLWQQKCDSFRRNREARKEQQQCLTA